MPSKNNRRVFIAHADEYDALSDEELVALIVAEPPCEEAAIYLTYERYNSLMVHMYQEYVSEKNFYYLDAATSYVYEQLKGSKHDWTPLRNFRGECHFAHFMKLITKQSFVKFYWEEIEKSQHESSMDYIDEDGDWVTITPKEAKGLLTDDQERTEIRLNLMESIRDLKNPDHRFCIIKKMEDYSVKEIAHLLQMKWEREGIVRHNNQGERIIPNEKYVNSLLQHARKAIKEIMEYEKK